MGSYYTHARRLREVGRMQADITAFRERLRTRNPSMLEGLRLSAVPQPTLARESHQCSSHQSRHAAAWCSIQS